MQGKGLIAVVLCVGFWFLGGCDPGDSLHSGPQNPVAELTSLTPGEAVACLPAFILTARGDDFISSSVIVFNGVDMTTEYISSSELRCTVNPDDTAAVAGNSQAACKQAMDSPCLVMVRNPAPGGGDSSSLEFLVRSNHLFSAPKLICASPRPARSPQMLRGEDGTLHLIWENHSTPATTTGYARSVNNGFYWTVPGSFNFPAHTLHKHGLALGKDGNPAAAWVDATGIRFSRSRDGGDTWSLPATVCSHAGPRLANRATLAVDGEDRWFAAWVMNSEIFVSRSTDGGDFWETEVNLSQNDVLINCLKPGLQARLESEAPCLAVDENGAVNLVWFFDAFDYGEPEYWYTHFSYIFHTMTSDGGLTWTMPQNRSTAQHYAYFPHLERGGDDRLSLSWHSQDTGDPWAEIRSFPVFCGRGDQSWDDAVEVAPGMNRSFYLDHQVDTAGNINVVWEDENAGDNEIYFSRSVNGGLTWSEPLNISSAPKDSKRPVLSCDPAGYLYLAWEDKRTGTWRIYFSSSRPK